MIGTIIIIVLLAGILGWTWTCAAYLRYISGQLNTVILEIQELTRKPSTH